MPKLTKRIVEAAQPNSDRELILWDTELPGFGLRVWPSGKRVYILKYRTSDGHQRKATIGQHGPLTTVKARTRALKWLSEAKHGGDPAGSALETRRAPTVGQLAQRYIEEHARAKKRPASIEADERQLRLYVLPALGRKKVASVTRADVAHLHHSMRQKPISANRCLALLSKMFNLAEKWDLRPDGTNPARHIERFRENRRERFLSNEELANLGKTLAEAETERIELPSVIAAIRLLLFTGCRRSEILTLRWDSVDFERGCLQLLESKTGSKTIHLSAPALNVLANLERIDDNPYVIVGAKPTTHLVNLTKPWMRIREQAGLNGVRLHDLRHSFASVAAAGGLSLPLIGALLGHTQPQTTARYAHLAADPLRQANDLVGKRIAAAMEPAQGKLSRIGQ